MVIFRAIVRPDEARERRVSRMGLLTTLKKVLIGSPERPLPELGRNDLCWCESGKKYKNCHLAADNRKRSAQRAATLNGSSANTMF